jgi:hypothetical protein
MDLMNIVRIAKVVALLAFALPWVAVSCQNVDVATASGIELMQGKMTANPDFEKQLGQQMGGFGGLGKNAGGGVDASASTSDLGINFFAIAAAIVILAGLGLTFAGKGKTAGRNALVSSLLGLALVFGTVWWWKDSASRDMSEQQGGRAETSSPFGNAGGGNPFGGGGMDAMGAQMMDNMLQERFGYWIALIALGIGAGAGGLVMMGGAPAAKPEGTPPVV